MFDIRDHSGGNSIPKKIPAKFNLQYNKEAVFTIPSFGAYTKSHQILDNGGVIYITSDFKSVKLILPNGVTAWTYNHTEDINVARIDSDNKYLYIGAKNSNILWKIDISDFSIIWSAVLVTSFGSKIISALTLVEKNGYLLCSNSLYLFLVPLDGSKSTLINTHSHVINQIEVRGDFVHICTNSYIFVYSMGSDIISLLATFTITTGGSSAVGNFFINPSGTKLIYVYYNNNWILHTADFKNNNWVRDANFNRGLPTYSSLIGAADCGDNSTLWIMYSADVSNGLFKTTYYNLNTLILREADYSDALSVLLQNYKTYDFIIANNTKNNLTYYKQHYTAKK